MGKMISLIRGGWALMLGALAIVLLAQLAPSREVACGPYEIGGTYRQDALCTDGVIPIVGLVAIGMVVAFVMWRRLKPMASRRSPNELVARVWTALAALAILAFFTGFISLTVPEGGVETPLAGVLFLSSVPVTAVLAASFWRVFR